MLLRGMDDVETGFGERSALVGVQTQGCFKINRDANFISSFEFCINRKFLLHSL